MTTDPKQDTQDTNEASSISAADVKAAHWFIHKVGRWLTDDSDEVFDGLDAAQRIIDEYRRRTGGANA